MVAIATIAAVLPVLVAAARAVGTGWMPVWDNAFPAIRAWDVLSGELPLLGTRSTAADMAGGAHVTHHPGPLEFYVLAPWVRLFGPAAGTVIGVASVNIVCILTVAWLAFRRGQHLALLVAMATMALLGWSVGSEMLFDPWPPHVTLFPFAVVMVAGWAVADRDLAAIPVLAVSASFVVQTHSGYAVVVPGVVVAAVTLLVWRVIAERRAESAEEGSWATRTTVLRWGAAGLVAGLVCWAAPLYEQIVHKGGNLTFMLDAIQAGREGSTYSLPTAVRLFAGTIALPPWWLPPSMDSPAIAQNGQGVSLPVSLVLLGTLAVALVVAAWRAHRRANHTLTSGLAIAAVVAGLTVFSMANAPVNLGLRTVAYLKFAWVTAAFVTMMLVLAVLDELKGRRKWFTDVPAPLAFMTVAVAAGLLALPRVDRADTGSEISDETHDLADAVLAEVRGQGTVLIEMDQPMSRVTWYGPGVLAELVGAGVPMVTRDPVLVAQLGDDREYRGSADLRLYIIPGEGPPMFSPGAQFVGSASRPARADDEELARRLRRRLRAALDRAGGLPIEDPDAVAEAVGRIPGYTNQSDVRRLVEQVRDLGPDPDAILDSTTTWGLVYLLDTLGVAYDMIDDDFPVDDLVRYGGLRDPADGPEVTVWLDHLD